MTNEHDFGQLVDKTAREYGLDPAMFWAQLQAESGAFNGPDGYKTARNAVGDTQDAPDVSIGYGQIRMNYLNDGPWAKDGTDNDRLGDQNVTTGQYDNSITTQLRMAAAIDAERIADNGGSVEKGLSVYVSGSPDTSGSKAQAYLQNIEKYMNDPNVEDV